MKPKRDMMIQKTTIDSEDVFRKYFVWQRLQKLVSFYCLLGLIACSKVETDMVDDVIIQEPPKIYYEAYFHGIVINEENEVLSDVSVMTDGREIKTTYDGSFLFDQSRVDKWGYRIMFIHEDFFPKMVCGVQSKLSVKPYYPILHHKVNREVVQNGSVAKVINLDNNISIDLSGLEWVDLFGQLHIEEVEVIWSFDTQSFLDGDAVYWDDRFKPNIIESTQTFALYFLSKKGELLVPKNPYKILINSASLPENKNLFVLNYHQPWRKLLSATDKEFVVQEGGIFRIGKLHEAVLAKGLVTNQSGNSISGVNIKKLSAENPPSDIIFPEKDGTFMFWTKRGEEVNLQYNLGCEEIVSKETIVSSSLEFDCKNQLLSKDYASPLNLNIMGCIMENVVPSDRLYLQIKTNEGIRQHWCTTQTEWIDLVNCPNIQNIFLKQNGITMLQVSRPTTNPMEVIWEISNPHKCVENYSAYLHINGKQQFFSRDGYTVFKEDALAKTLEISDLSTFSLLLQKQESSQKYVVDELFIFSGGEIKCSGSECNFLLVEEINRVSKEGNTLKYIMIHGRIGHTYTLLAEFLID